MKFPLGDAFILLLALSCLPSLSTGQTTPDPWRHSAGSFEPPHWRAAKGNLDWWTIAGKRLFIDLSSNTPAWLLSGTRISGSWAIEATFEPPFVYRDEGLLLNTAPDLSRGLLVSIGPFAKLTLLRIKNGEIDSVAMEFPLAPA
ncbi:MAG TPA: hypothetical protein VEZ90_09005, partial [Blastocatellia bacterium]|nr:hypothetical protein [Blastocatellia bacterium]